MERSGSGESLMKAVVLTYVDGQEIFQVQQVPVPNLKADEVLIKVLAIAVNETDIIERYKCGSCSVRKPSLGYECSGIIVKVGEQVQNWKVHEEVCAILNGKGYAEMMAVPKGQVFPIPNGISLLYAASLPLAACIVWSELFTESKLSAAFWLPKNGRARLSSGERILVPEDCSGIYKFVVQLAENQGASAHVISQEELELSNKSTPDDFGVDVIFDRLGMKYFPKYYSCLKPNGRIISIGKCSFNTQDHSAVLPEFMSPEFSNYFEISGASFWKRSRESIEKIVEEVKESVWPLIEAGKVFPPRPILVFPFSEAAEAHHVMENSMEIGKYVGKILLTPDVNL